MLQILWHSLNPLIAITSGGPVHHGNRDITGRRYGDGGGQIAWRQRSTAASHAGCRSFRSDLGSTRLPRGSRAAASAGACGRDLGGNRSAAIASRQVAARSRLPADVGPCSGDCRALRFAAGSGLTGHFDGFRSCSGLEAGSRCSAGKAHRTAADCRGSGLAVSSFSTRRLGLANSIRIRRSAAGIGEDER